LNKEVKKEKLHAMKSGKVHVPVIEKR